MLKVQWDRWLVGLALFAVIASAYALHACWLFAKGRPELNLFYGPLSVGEELDSELDALKARNAEGMR